MTTWGQPGAGAFVLAALTSLASACAGPVEATVTVRPPDPVPQPEEPAEVSEPVPARPADDDGDGLVGAADRCPGEAETKNGYRDDDGCADEVPPVYLADDEVRYQGPLAFGPTGALDGPSKATVSAIAEVLAGDASLEQLEVGVGFAGKKGDTFASKQRAQVLLDALVKEGVARKRLRSAGYGACGGTGAGFVIRLAVVQRGGALTGVKLGCRE